MSFKYHLAENTIPKEDYDALSDWLRTYPRLTKGDLTWQFEKRWAETVGSRHAVMCNSGSSANLLALAALKYSNVLPNNRIVFCAAGWITTITPALQLGFESFLVEVDSRTFGMDMVALQETIRTVDPAVVMVVHTLGMPVNLQRLQELQEKYGFYLIEDACPAVGSCYGGKPVGTFGDLGTFSLYYGHQLSTIEGGVVVTDDDELYEFLLMLRSHGWGKDLEPPTRDTYRAVHDTPIYRDDFTFYTPGFNLRSTDLNAFLGLRQVTRFSKVAQQRHERFKLYQELLGGTSLLVQQETPSDAAMVVSCITFPFICTTEAQRDRIYNALVNKGVECRPISGGNLGEQPAWLEYFGHGTFAPYFAHHLHTCGIAVPCHPDLSLDDVRYISGIIVENSDAVQDMRNEATGR